MDETHYKKPYTQARGKKKTRQDSDEKMMMLQRMCIEALKCYETSKKSFSLDPSELNHSKLQSSIKVLRRLQTKMTQELETSSNHQNILKYSNIAKENIFKGSKLNTLNAYSNITLDKDKRKQKQCRMLSGVPDCPADNENPSINYGIYSTSKELKNMRPDSVDGQSSPKQKFFENTYSEKKSKANKVSSHDKRYYNLPNSLDLNDKECFKPKDLCKKRLQRLRYSKSEDHSIPQSSQSESNLYITTHSSSHPTTPTTPPHNPSIIAIDDYEFRSEDNTSWEEVDPGFNNVDALCDHIPHTIILLYYLMCNSDPSPLFLVLLTSKLKKVSKKDSIQYLYSIHCIFLQKQAPLRVDMEGEVVESIEEVFECSTPEKVKQERCMQIIKEVHQSSKKRLRTTMKEFESIIQLGLGSLFGDEMLKNEQNVPKKINEIANKLLLPHYQQLITENNEYSLCVTACLEAFFKLINFPPQTSTKTPLTTSKSSVLPSSSPSSMFSKKSSLPEERRTFPPLPPKNMNYTTSHSWSSSSFFSSPPSTYNSFSISKFCSMLKEKHRPKIKIRFVKEHHLRTSEYNTPIYCDLCSYLVCSVGNYGLECQKCSKNFHLLCVEHLEDNCKYKKITRLINKNNKGNREYKINEKSRDTESIDYSTLHGKLKTEKLSNLRMMSNKNFQSLSHLEIGRLNNDNNDDDDDEVYDEDNAKRGSSEDKKIDSNERLNQQKADNKKKENNLQNDLSDSTIFLPVPFPDSDLQVCDSPVLKKMNLQQNNDKRKQDLKELKKQHAINELITTQQTHVRFLKIVYNTFFVPMYHNMQTDFVYLLFPNLDDVISIHEGLMRELKELRDSSEVELVWRLGHTLFKHFSGSNGEKCKEVFATFIRKQPLALEVLKSFIRKDDKFAAFMEKAYENPLCARLTLKDMLPYVMQRITKYPLLIDSIIKLLESTSAPSSCIEIYKKVHTAVKSIASHVNKAVSEFEGIYKLTALQSMLIKKPISHLTNHSQLPYVDLYKEFDLTEHKHSFDGPLTWHISDTQQNPMHAVLLQDMLVLLYKQQQVTKSTKPPSSIAILADISSPTNTLVKDKTLPKDNNSSSYYNVKSLVKNKNKPQNYVTNLLLTYQCVSKEVKMTNNTDDIDGHYHVTRLINNNQKNNKNNYTNNNNNNNNNEENKEPTRHSPILKIDDITVKILNKEECTFVISCTSKWGLQDYVMEARSTEEMMNWCKRISQTKQIYLENVVYDASFYYAFDGRNKDSCKNRKKNTDKYHGPDKCDLLRSNDTFDGLMAKKDKKTKNERGNSFDEELNKKAITKTDHDVNNNDINSADAYDITPMKSTPLGASPNKNHRNTPQKDGNIIDNINAKAKERVLKTEKSITLTMEEMLQELNAFVAALDHRISNAKHNEEEETEEKDDKDDMIDESFKSFSHHVNSKDLLDWSNNLRERFQDIMVRKQDLKRCGVNFNYVQGTTNG